MTIAVLKTNAAVLWVFVAPHRDKEVPEGGGHPPTPREEDLYQTGLVTRL